MGDRRSLVWWLSASAILAAAYWICLRFLFPGYFHPDWPSHDDFYLYASMGELSWAQISKFPRPAAYGVMKILGTFGLPGVMAGSIALALVNLLLILALAKRLLAVETRWGLLAVAVFSLLVCAHPQFYFDHRHDLPAQASLLFLLLAFWAALEWTPGRRRWLLGVAALGILIFAFAKETYFVTAAVAWLALAIADRPRRKAHIGLLVFVLAAEVASIAWTRHINGPFVDPNAGPDAAYRMSLAPRDVLLTYAYYSRHALTVGLALWILLCLACAWRSRTRGFTVLAFLAAGLAVFVPHAVLPNHKIAEYAWAAVPFLLAPVLLIVDRPPARYLVALAGVVLLVWTGVEYHRRYRSADLVWGVEQERRGGHLVDSFTALDAIPRPSRIAVAGVETPFVPWSSPFFIRGRFGSDRQWTVIVRPERMAAPFDPVTRLATARFVNLGDYDALVTYAPDGRLSTIRYKKEISGGRDLLVPDWAAAVQRAESSPQSYAAWMAAARTALDWGLWEEARAALDRARPLSPGSEPLWQVYAANASLGLGDAAAAERQLAGLPPSMDVTELHRRIEQMRDRVQPALAAVPPSISNPDPQGLGVIELRWTAPAGTRTEIHVNTPDGPMFTSGGASGQARTDNWVKDGMEFFLQDVTEGRPLTADHTLARVKVGVAKP